LWAEESERADGGGARDDRPRFAAGRRGERADGGDIARSRASSRAEVGALVRSWSMPGRSHAPRGPEAALLGRSWLKLGCHVGRSPCSRSSCSWVDCRRSRGPMLVVCSRRRPKKAICLSLRAEAAVPRRARPELMEALLQVPLRWAARAVGFAVDASLLRAARGRPPLRSRVGVGIALFVSSGRGYHWGWPKLARRPNSRSSMPGGRSSTPVTIEEVFCCWEAKRDRRPKAIGQVRRRGRNPALLCGPHEL